MKKTHYSLVRVEGGYQFAPSKEKDLIFNSVSKGVENCAIFLQRKDLEFDNFLEIIDKLFKLPYDPEFPIKFYAEEYSRFESIPQAKLDMEEEFPKFKNELKIVFLMHHPKFLPQIVMCEGCHLHAKIMDAEEETGNLFDVNITSKKDGLAKVEDLKESGEISSRQASAYHKLLEESEVDKMIEEFRGKEMANIFASFFIPIFGPMGQA